MENNKLSHSAVSRYLKCPQSYKHHYVNKYRPTVTSSALLFGSALDATIEAILVDKDADYMPVFFDNWERGFINKKKVELPLNTNIAYAERDMDWDLLESADFLKLVQFIADKKLEYIASGDLKDTYKKVVDFKKQRSFRKFRQAEHEYLNYANWLCMARKAPLMVEAFKEQALPRITEVHSAQKQIELKNEDGDIARGYIDMIVTLDDGKKYVLDLKTSARKYDANAANESAQLSLYAFHEGIEDVGYVVIYKNIAKDKTRVCTACRASETNNRVKTCSNDIGGKRCGAPLDEEVVRRAELDIILGKVNEGYTKAVLENFDIVNKLIKQDIYYKNLDSCSNWFGGDCPFKGLCFGDSSEGLICEK